MARSGHWGTAEALRSSFRRRFQAEPEILCRAPGRVNIIGEHTDYNQGLVLPAAIDRYVFVAARRCAGPVLHWYAADLDEEVILPADRPQAPPAPRWARYIQGVAGELLRAGVRLHGMMAAVGGDLPAGAGLSSSAALEVAVALALLAVAAVHLERRQVALLAQRAEVEFVGVRCGIMDQFAAALSSPGCALFLDCRSLEYRHVPLPPSLVLVVCHTGVRRALQDSAYNQRRQECEEAAALLRRIRPQIRSLRDLDLDDLPLLEGLPYPLGRRARHVVTENRRVREAMAALERADVAALGGLLAASHASLRDDFAVSIPELEAMKAAADAAPGCLGARLVGAGFGGAVLALVQRAAATAFVGAAAAAYQASTGREGAYLVCEAAGGAEVRTADPGGRS
ncbi:MAG: galactokinase [Armatimonadota bacterium]|nr:galactokinase [Armatimonadota bacterium]